MVKLLQIKQRMSPLKMNYKNQKKFQQNQTLLFCLFFGTINRFDSEDGTQAYLIFQPMHRCFKLIVYTKHIA